MRNFDEGDGDDRDPRNEENRERMSVEDTYLDSLVIRRHVRTKQFARKTARDRQLYFAFIAERN